MTTTPLTTGVDFLTIWTQDYDRSVAFYTSVLGLPHLPYGRIPGGEYETGNLTLQVLDCESVGASFTPSTPIALHVDDVAEARADLESKGVEFTAAFDSGVCHQAIFHDPDGNTLILHHRYAPRDAEPASASET
jgi:catechol 2,3-dioxygenase-like lactoylglutathione lyase family enzyme